MKHTKLLLSIGKVLMAFLCTTLGTGCSSGPVEGPPQIFVNSPVGIYYQGTIAALSGSFVPSVDEASVDLRANYRSVFFRFFPFNPWGRTTGWNEGGFALFESGSWSTDVSAIRSGFSNFASQPFTVYEVQGSMSLDDSGPTPDFWLIEPRPAEETQAILDYLYGNPEATSLEYSTRAFAEEPMVKHHLPGLRPYRQQIAEAFRQSRVLPQMWGSITMRYLGFINSQFTPTPQQFSRKQLDDISSFFAQFETELLDSKVGDGKNNAFRHAAAAQFRSLIRSIQKAEGKTLKEFLREDPAERNGSSASSDDLLASFPNPFNPVTTITYQVSEPSPIALRVFDVTGREVCTLVNGFQQTGLHSVSFDGTNLGSGLYFVRLETQSSVKIHKLVLLK